MSKTLIVLMVGITGLLAVGCATLTPEEKQKRLKDSVVGEYEMKHKGDTYKLVYLENGITESYVNGKNRDVEFKWSIVKEEIQVDWSGSIVVYRINKDKNITEIAGIGGIHGKRRDLPKEKSVTYIKIK